MKQFLLGVTSGGFLISTLYSFYTNVTVGSVAGLCAGISFFISGYLAIVEKPVDSFNKEE